VGEAVENLYTETMGKKKLLLAMISILLGLLIVEPIIYTPADAR